MCKNALDKRKDILARELYYSFFNRFLLESGMLTDSEYRKMQNLILKEINRERKKGVFSSKQGY